MNSSQSPPPSPSNLHIGDTSTHTHTHTHTHTDTHQTLSSTQSTNLPRYLNKTLSSLSSNSQNNETERIKRSFQTGNYYSIKKLPSRLQCGLIEESRKHLIAQSLAMKPQYTYKANTINHYFTPLSYARTEYNKIAENEREEAQFQRLTTLSFSRKPFTYASSRVRLKNEDIFGNEEYKYPVLGPGHGKVDLSNYVRKDFTDAGKMIHGPFFVVGRRRGEREVPRDQVEIWSKEIFDLLSTDWGHLRFSIRFTGDDELVVSFDTALLESDGQIKDRALARYMGHLARHGVAAERRLRKRGDRWRVLEWEDATPGGSEVKQVLVFSFYAPWYTAGHVPARKTAATAERTRTRRTARAQRESLSSPVLVPTLSLSQSQQPLPAIPQGDSPTTSQEPSSRSK